MSRSKLSQEELEYLVTHERLPMWVELHVQQVADKLGSRKADWLSKEQKAVVEEECRKLDEFCEVLCTSKASHVEAEKKAFGTDGSFYRSCEEAKLEWRRELEKERLRKEREAARAKAEAEKAEQKKAEERKPKEFDLQTNLHLEKGLSKKQREELMRNDFKRLKISPFGDSGAAYYWVRTEWHESKEHAFFCRIIEAEVRKFAEEVKVNYYDSPDVEFTFRDHRFCFEVETGEILKRNKEYLIRRYREMEREYSKVFVFVTSKKLKYKYSKFGTVVTRGTLRKVLAKEFRAMPAEKPA